MTKSLDVRLKNDRAEIGRLGDLIGTFGAEHQLPAETVFNLTLVVEELVTNAMTHGGAGQGDDFHVAVHISLDGSEIRTVIEDSGPPFDPLAEAPEPDLDSALEDRPVGGLGLHFAKTFSDSFAYQRAGDLNRSTVINKLKT